MKEQTRKEIRQKMADYRQPAPDVSWDVLEEALAANRKAKSATLWPRRVAAAAAVVMVAGLGWQVLKPEHDTKEPTTTVATADNKQSQQTPMADVQEPTTDLMVADATTAPQLPRIIAQSLVAAANTPTENTLMADNSAAVSNPALQDAPTNTNISDKPQEKQAEPSDSQPAKQPAATPQQQRQAQHRQHPSYPADLSRGSLSRAGRLTAKAYVANAMLASNNASSYSPLMSAASPYGTTSDATSKTSVPLRGQQADIEENIHHRQPIRVGLSVRYQLSKRWSIESGLAYSYLSSDITHTINNYTAETHQKLSYIGIPVNANYKVWGNKHFSVYATAGGMVEKMVKGSQETIVSTDGQPEEATKEDVSIRPLQYSVNGGVGAEYHIGKRFSVYAEPGLSYHFDNHSSVQTFYQDKPLSFNLNAGLRLNLGK